MSENMRHIYKCVQCGGEIEEIKPGLGKCIYCGSKQPIPQVHDEKLEHAYKLRMANQKFDEAKEIYDEVIKSNCKEAEAYWGRALCKYNIEYVLDNDGKTYKPTCHKMDEILITEDADYKFACEYAEDEERKKFYEVEAKRIAKTQKDILDVTRTIEPYDIFISFKATDSNGQHTLDRKIAYDIYNQLTAKGRRVFFSEISLQNDFTGGEYEPYIFAALNSSKVMILVGTQLDYIESAWVKNEWSRFCRMAEKNPGTKKLIPLIEEALLKEQDFPSEVRKYQSVPMVNGTYSLDDLLQKVEGTLAEYAGKEIQRSEKIENDAVLECDKLVGKTQNAISRNDFASAGKYINEALNSNPNSGRANWLSLLCQLGIREDQIRYAKVLLSQYPEYERACQFAKTDQEKAEYLEICKICESNYNYQMQYDAEYQNCCNAMGGKDVQEKLYEMRKELARNYEIREQIKLKNLVFIIASLVFGIISYIGLFSGEAMNNYYENVGLYFKMVIVGVAGVSYFTTRQWMDVKPSAITAGISLVIQVVMIYILSSRYMEGTFERSSGIYLVPYAVLHIFFIIAVILFLHYIYKFMRKKNLLKKVNDINSEFRNVLGGQTEHWELELKNIADKYISNANEYQKQSLQIYNGLVVQEFAEKHSL